MLFQEIKCKLFLILLTNRYSRMDTVQLTLILLRHYTHQTGDGEEQYSFDFIDKVPEFVPSPTHFYSPTHSPLPYVLMFIHTVWYTID